MKKFIKIIVSVLIFTIMAGVLVSCSRSGKLVPLTDENGNYSEEAFAKNMASYKYRGLKLFASGKTKYKIIYPVGSEKILTDAVSDLATTLKEISGIDFECIDDTAKPSSREICVGATNRTFSEAATVTDPAAYYLMSEDDRIFIYANSGYGASNGVYGFLEDYLGVMYMDETYTYYPTLNKAVLPALNDFQTPAFEVRDTHTSVTRDERYRRRLRLTCNEVFDSDGCHHSLDYISVSEYFDEHPEYFALIGGERRSSDYLFQSTQLCWSNPEVIELLAKTAEKKIADYRKNGITRTIYWDFSQEDSMNRCQCSNCKALENEYGSPIAPILLAVNEIARRFPDSNFSEPFDRPIDYAKKVGEMANMLGAGHILVQRFGDILEGKRTWQKELSRTNIKPTLSDAVAGDITAAIPFRPMQNIINFIKMMDTIVPGFAGKETLLYAPEIKFYSNKIILDENFMTSIKNLHALGDSSGWTRGLMMSSVMGVVMGNSLLKSNEI